MGGNEGMRFKRNIPRYMAPSIHGPLDAAESSCTLGRDRAPKDNVSTSMLDGGDGVLGVIFSILPPPNAASRVDAKELDFHLTTSCLPILLRIIQVFIGKLQTALYMCFLEQGDLASAAVLQTITA